MPYQRYEQFDDAELHELRIGLKYSAAANRLALRTHEGVICDRMDDEIAHVQEQREMRRRREELPA